jgi:hypothetical protein
MSDKIYPDISNILSAKARRRRALVALPWEKKVAIIEHMRTLLPKDQWKPRPKEQTTPTQDPPS